MINYKLYLDDIRTPPDGAWKVVRSFTDAVFLISRLGCPNFISFDHDLGEGKDGYDLAKWIVKKDLDSPGFIPSDFGYYVHSANIIGKVNIEKYLDSYLKSRTKDGRNSN